MKAELDLSNYAIKAYLKNVQGIDTSKSALNAKINEVQIKISNITNLVTTTALTAVENKTPKLVIVNLVI